MPRPKTINTPSIKLEKITGEIVERKNCLGVELVFNTPFTQAQATVLSGFYRFRVSPNRTVLSRTVKNSWKGLISMLVSIAYCKYGGSLVSKMWDSINHAKLKRQFTLRVDFLYESFIGEKELEELQRSSIVCLPQEEILDAFQNREQHRINAEKRRQQAFLNSLKKRNPDPAFENVSAPDSWRPCYLSARYEVEDIVDYLKLFSKLLEMDESKSIIQTDFATQLPHKYKIYPAVYHDDSQWRT